MAEGGRSKMIANCTCGSPLPPGASFCPRCGRPLAPGVGEPEERLEPTVPPEPAPRQLTAKDYFRAVGPPAIVGIALRFVVSALALLVGLGEFAAMLGFGVVWLAAHYAVRRFEQRVAPISGLWHGFGVGALTGLLCYLPSLVTQLAVLGGQGQEAFLEALREQAENSSLIAGAVTALEDPTIFWGALAFTILVEAMVLTAGAGAFGALAAKSVLNER